ncbi:MAG: CPBP family intramembrane glutamic endopeptidase [Gemmatimonadales bacterium]
MRRLVERHPVLVFFLLALAISWAGWIPYAAARSGRTAAQIPAEIIWAAEFGPTLAALILTGWLAGLPAVGRLLRRLVAWRVAPRWYLLALLITPALAALVALAMPLLGRGPVDPTLLGAWAERFRARTAAFTPSAGLISGLVDLMGTSPARTLAVFALLAITNGGISEEVGWRGFAQPRLQAKHSGALAAVGVGVLWGLWHTGTGFWQMLLTGAPAEAATFAVRYLGQYLLLVVPLAVIYAVLWNGTGGSLLLCILLHASYNMTITVVTSAWPAFPIGLMIGLLWVVAVALAIGFRTTLLARREEPA